MRRSSPSVSFSVVKACAPVDFVGPMDHFIVCVCVVQGDNQADSHEFGVVLESMGVINPRECGTARAQIDLRPGDANNGCRPPSFTRCLAYTGSIRGD